MSELKLEVGKKYKSLNGVKYKLVYISTKGLLVTECENSVVSVFEKDVFYEKFSEYTEPKKLSGWVNFYEKRCPSPVFNTKENANYDNSKHCIGEKRIACIDLSQFNIGEGL